MKCERVVCHNPGMSSGPRLRADRHMAQEISSLPFPLPFSPPHRPLSFRPSTDIVPPSKEDSRQRKVPKLSLFALCVYQRMKLRAGGMRGLGVGTSQCMCERGIG